MTDFVPKKIESFFLNFPQETYKRGDCVIRPDETKITHVYLLESGFVRQYALSRDGEEKNLMLFRPPAIFPIVYVLDPSENNHYFFEAQSDVVVRKVPAEKVVEFLHANPDSLFELTVRFARGIAMETLMLENIMSTCALHKITVVLLNFARRFGTPQKYGVRIEFPLTHKEIGNYAGVTRETVSREIQKLIDKKLITKENNIYTIPDIIAFESLLDR